MKPMGGRIHNEFRIMDAFIELNDCKFLLEQLSKQIPYPMNELRKSSISTCLKNMDSKIFSFC